MGQNKGARHTAQAGTGWVQAGQLRNKLAGECSDACRIIWAHVSGGVDEECDVGDGDERSPHDPDERGAPIRKKQAKTSYLRV